MPSTASFESLSDIDYHADHVPVFRKGCRPSVVSTIMEDVELQATASLSDIRKSSIATRTSDADSRRGSSAPHKDKFQILVLGAARVGKTALIHQFLYDSFPSEYRATVEQLHRGEYEVKGDLLTLEILDTSGYYYFPAMRRLEITKADAILLVYAIDDEDSFEEVRHLRELVAELRPQGVPTVVVGNKCDLNSCRRTVRAEIAETVTLVDWEHGYVECSAKNGTKVIDVFKEVLAQSQIQYALSPAVKRRRKSLPVQHTQPRLKSTVALKRNSCTVS